MSTGAISLDAFDDDTGVDRVFTNALFYGRFERGVKGMQRLLRWPLLLLIFAVVFFELSVYFGLRLIIFVYEMTMSRLFDRYHKNLVALNNHVESYQEWYHQANLLDSALDHDFYKAIDQSPFYSWSTVKNMLRQLSSSVSDLDRRHTQRSAERLELLLNRSYNANTSGLGIDNARLYAETFHGTKNILQRYIDTVLEATESYINIDPKLIGVDRKQRHICNWRATYGRTALCLSSGGAIAYLHIGVVRTLLQSSLLPNIICGSSGGALVAGIVATRTDSELESFLTPDMYRHLTCCSDSWGVLLKRYWFEKKFFDEKVWRSKLGSILFGDITFLEAFQRTGRILCITCTSENKYGTPIVLNYMTTPSVVIRDAILASSAMAPLLPPITLMFKTSKGSIKPFLDFGKCWADGAIKNDIPAKQLAEQFNVNYIIVSQVNPHIVPFVYESRGSPGCPMRRFGSGLRGGFVLSAAESLLKLELQKWMRVVSDLDIMPMIFSQDWSRMFLQKHWGNVTIYPSRGWRALYDTAMVVSNPTKATMHDYIARGQRATYPKVVMIANHLRLEQMLLNADQRVPNQHKLSFAI